jgi:hypothetical protein
MHNLKRIVQMSKGECVSSNGKIFYVSFQLVGTKHFGRFMEKNGYKVASWKISEKNRWSQNYYDGKINSIIKSPDFLSAQVFEDGPWFQPFMVKFIYHEFPDAKFVLLTRPPIDWFKSMIKHSGGVTVGLTERHCEVYDRLEDYEWLREHSELKRDACLSLFDKPMHYINIYKKKTLEVKSFFNRMSNSSDRVFIGDLYADDVYERIAHFLCIKRPVFLDRIVHKTKIATEQCVSMITQHLNNSLSDHHEKIQKNSGRHDG